MNVQALGIFLGEGRRIGVLFRYTLAADTVVTRFVADEEFIQITGAPTVSAGWLADAPLQQQALWRDVRSTAFNGRFSNRNGWLLPSFFQNLLPEGVFRDRVAELRGCDPRDHFEMLAACGRDLPGQLLALPVALSRDELARCVTQQQDALEMSVSAEPLDDGVSLSGVQPKVGAIRDGDRYVARTKDHDTHIIAKLPVVAQPLLPEVEGLSLRLAAAAGVEVCEAWLEPLEKLAVRHGYDLGDADARTQFLAVRRFDRGEAGRVHCEDFAQVLGVMPEDKYGTGSEGGPRTCLDVAAVLMGFDSLGEAAVHELLRRLVVNEMLGNPDMHLKNIGLVYPDGVHPRLGPAYDIVAYAAYSGHQGHALALLPAHLAPPAGRAAARARLLLSPAVVRAFCAALRIPEKPAATAIRLAVRAACAQWPAMIAAAPLTAMQKSRLLAHFHAHPLVASVAKRVVAIGGIGKD
jgi:serine/threonine-protein kinase HipA